MIQLIFRVCSETTPFSPFEGKIKELFSKDTINNTTVLVLVNAVYFKAKWEKYFESENTVDAPFSPNEVLYLSMRFS